MMVVGGFVVSAIVFALVVVSALAVASALVDGQSEQLLG